jgi:hypothetical protein
MSFTEKLVNAFLGFSIFTPGYLAFQFGCESHPEVGHTLRILAHPERRTTVNLRPARECWEPIFEDRTWCFA